MLILENRLVTVVLQRVIQYSTVGVLVMVSSELVVLLIVCVSTGSTQGEIYL